MKILELAGTKVLLRPGNGTTVVLLHGIGSNAESWRPLMVSLPPGLCAMAWWAPGYGASRPVAAERPTPDDYAARLAEVLDTLGLPRVVLAGHSLGCLFAARFAATRPDRVAALALLSPALGYRVPPGAALPPTVQARIDDLATLGPAAFAQKRAGRLVAQAHALPAVARAMAEVNLPGYAQAVHALGAGDLLGDAARLRRAALVACGADDLITPPGNAEALHAALPHGSVLHLLPGCGHALPQEEPGIVGRMLAELAEAAHA